MIYRILSILVILNCTTLAEESPRATMKKGLELINLVSTKCC